MRWTSSKTGGTVRVYYDTDKNPSVKTLIGSTSASSVNGSLNWNTSSLPQDAQYYVYVEFDDGTNVNGAYSKWPVRIDHSGASTARLVLNRSLLNFGVAAGTIKTPQQLLRLSTVERGRRPAVLDGDRRPVRSCTVSPTSGCGAATLTVSLVNQTYHGTGDFAGYIRVTSSGAINSPQVVQTVVRVIGATSAAVRRDRHACQRRDRCPARSRSRAGRSTTSASRGSRSAAIPSPASRAAIPRAAPTRSTSATP